MTAARSALRDEGGQTIVLVALALTALLVGVGLAIDTGQLFVARRNAQSAADAAAWAGAVKIFQGGTATAAISAATSDASLNGFSTGGSTTVTAVSPPTSGEFSGDARYIQVSISLDVATSFIPGATAGKTRITVTATGGAPPYGSGYAILTLSPDEQQAFKISGNGNINVSGAGVMVNSNANQAAQLSGSGSVVVASPYVTQVVGGVQTSGSGSFTPAAVTGGTSAADPYTALPEPSITGQPVYSNTDMSSDTCSASANWVCSGSTYVLSPGVYDGGIKISGNGTVTLNAGTYILRKGGFQMSGNGSLTGAGVTLFNTVADHPLSTGACDQWKVSGNGAVTLSAPTSGTYKGMLVWQDEDCSNKVISWSGNGAITSSSGTIYGPTAEFEISGNGEAAMNVNTQIVTNTFRVSGNAAINLNYTSGANAPPLVPALVK